MQRIWNIAKPDLRLQLQLKKDLGICPTLAQILINRGISDPRQAAEFLKPHLSNLIPSRYLPDIAIAKQRIKKAIKSQEKILIFGDYDADGITSTALLKAILTKMGLEVIHYLPNRLKEGYGLSRQAIRLAKQEGVGLFISVDCGSSSLREIEQLRRMDIDVIVLDHHQPTTEESLPALAFINPKRKDSQYAYKDLAGVGITYKFAQAITQQTLEEDLDLVCLGTIADVVPLNGENRIIARHGLKALANSNKPGIRALIKQNRINNNFVNAFSVSYIIGPRINASGRIGSAETALNLLLSESEREADGLAGIVNRHNQRRQEIEATILREAKDLVEKEVNFKQQRVIVVAKEGWHQGVLGIVASKIADKFYRPAIVISTADTLCRGSCRSIKNFHILEALLGCKHLLGEFGGHKHAAGLSIARDKIGRFRQAINQIASEKIALEDLYPSLDIDMEVNLSHLTEEMATQLKDLAPFGEGNPQPLFYTRNLKLKSEPQILSRDTLRFWVTDGERTFKAVGFNMGSLKYDILGCECFDLVYTPTLDEWQEPACIQLEVKDIRLLGNRL